MVIDMFRASILGDFTTAKHYLESVFASVAVEREAQLAAWRHEAESNDIPEQEFIGELIGIENHFDFSVPRILSHSYTVYLHSLIESALYKICADLKSTRGLRLGVKDLSGSAIDKCHKYLTKVANLDSSGFNEWSMLRDLQVLRDLIVHNAAELPADAQQLEKVRQLAIRYPGLVTASPDWNSPSAELVIAADICIQFTNAAHTFFTRLLNMYRPPSFHF